MKKSIIILLMVILTVLQLAQACLAARVESTGGKIYIVDRVGERWEVSQARELGFLPQGFQYGIGKNAFSPLQDKDFGVERPSSTDNARIIGISIDGDAHAYAVNRLIKHEIANTTIAGKEIAAGY